MLRFSANPTRFHHHHSRLPTTMFALFSRNPELKAILSSPTSKWRNFLKKNNNNTTNNNNKNAQLSAMSVSSNQWQQFLDKISKSTIDDLPARDATRLIISLCFEGHTPWALSAFRRCFSANTKVSPTILYPILALAHLKDFLVIHEISKTVDLKTLMLDHISNKHHQDDKSLEAARILLSEYRNLSNQEISANNGRRFAALLGLIIDPTNSTIWLKDFLFASEQRDFADEEISTHVKFLLKNSYDLQNITLSIWRTLLPEENPSHQLEKEILNHFCEKESKAIEHLLTQNRHVTSHLLFDVLPTTTASTPINKSVIRKYLLHESHFTSSKLNSLFVLKKCLEILLDQTFMTDFSNDEANRLSLALENLVKVEEPNFKELESNVNLQRILFLLDQDSFTNNKYTQLLAPSLLLCLRPLRFIFGLQKFTRVFLKLCENALTSTLTSVSSNYFQHKSPYLESKMILCERLFLATCSVLSLYQSSNQIVTQVLSGKILKDLLFCFPQSAVFVLPILDDEVALRRIAESFAQQQQDSHSDMDHLKIVISILERRFPLESGSREILGFVHALSEQILATTKSIETSLLLFLYQTCCRFGIQLLSAKETSTNDIIAFPIISKMLNRLLELPDSGSKLKVLLCILPFQQTSFAFLENAIKKYLPESDHLGALCLFSAFHSLGPGSETVKMVVAKSSKNNNIQEHLLVLESFATTLLAIENMNNNIDFLVETIASVLVAHLLPLMILKMKSETFSQPDVDKIKSLHQTFLNFFIQNDLFQLVKFNEEYKILGYSANRYPTHMSSETMNVAVTIFALEFLWRRIFDNLEDGVSVATVDHEKFCFLLPAPLISRRISAMTSKIPSFNIKDCCSLFGQITKDIDFLLLIITSKTTTTTTTTTTKSSHHHHQPHRLVKLLHEVFPHNNKRNLPEEYRLVSNCPILFRLQNPESKLILSRMLRDVAKIANDVEDDKNFRHVMDQGNWMKALSICSQQIFSRADIHPLSPHFWVSNRRAISACFAAGGNDDQHHQQRFVNAWYGALQVIQCLDGSSKTKMGGLSATTITGNMIYNRCISLLRQTARWREMMLLLDSHEPQRTSSTSLNSFAQLCYARRKDSRPMRDDQDDAWTEGKNESLLRLVCWLRSRSFPRDVPDIMMDENEVVKFRQNQETEENEDLLAYRSAMAALSVSFVRNGGFDAGAELLVPAMKLTRESERMQKSSDHQKEDQAVMKSSRDREFYKNCRTAFREIVRHLETNKKMGDIWKSNWQLAIEFAMHNGREDWAAKIHLGLKVGF